jgi:hypothetical protein
MTGSQDFADDPRNAKTLVYVWPAGRRATDGVWAPAWYVSVVRSTGFEPQGSTLDVPLPPHLEALADEAQPHYEALRSHRIV